MPTDSSWERVSVLGLDLRHRRVDRDADEEPADPQVDEPRQQAAAQAGQLGRPCRRRRRRPTRHRDSAAVCGTSSRSSGRGGGSSLTGPPSSAVATSAERADVAAAVAVEQQRPDPGGVGARDVLLGGVADVERLAGGAAGDLEGLREDHRVGLTRARPGGGHDAVQRVAQAAALEHLGQRHVPVRDAHQAQAARPQLGQGRRARRGRRGTGSRPSSSRPGPRGRAPRRGCRRSGRAGRRRSRRRAPRASAPCSRPSPCGRPVASSSLGSTPSSDARWTQGGSSSTRVPSASRKTARLVPGRG